MGPEIQNSMGRRNSVTVWSEIGPIGIGCKEVPFSVQKIFLVPEFKVVSSNLK